jgi:flagellar hook-associated protein 2
MAGMSVDGLVSGLDTTALISQLMQVEAIPQTQLKRRASAAEKMVAALQSINTRVASLASAAEKVAKSATWQGAKASSSSSTVTATATTGATTGQVTFDVVQLASSQFVATAPFDDLATVVPGGSLTISRGAVTRTVDVTGKEPADVVDEINALDDLDVRATLLSAPNGQQRLQITSRTTGAADQFTVTGLAGTTFEQPGSDAVLRLGRDAAGNELLVTSGSNTFTDLVPGSSITVGDVQDGVTVTVTHDDGPTVDAVKSLVSALNVALGEIASQTRTADSDGTVAGPLAGDSMLRQLSQSLLGAVTAGGSVSGAGIELTRDGKVELDEAKLEDALAENPTATRDLVQALATRLGDLANAASDGSDSTIALAIDGKKSSVDDLNQQVEDWDARLELRRTALQRQFSALEVALSSMQQQSSWLAGQIAGLPTWSSGS